jgi:hypothetical protein
LSRYYKQPAPTYERLAIGIASLIGLSVNFSSPQLLVMLDFCSWLIDDDLDVVWQVLDDHTFSVDDQLSYGRTLSD